jgi:2-isopropylmalate synthase
MEISKMVSDFTGIPIPKTQPFVGLNAFRHESGIHVAAILENPRTYECISPDLVGNKRYLVFGKHSGRHSIKKILQDKVEEQLLRKITFKVKELGERNGEVSREEVIQLFNEYRR